MLGIEVIQVNPGLLSIYHLVVVISFLFLSLAPIHSLRSVCVYILYVKYYLFHCINFMFCSLQVGDEIKPIGPSVWHGR